MRRYSIALVGSVVCALLACDTGRVQGPIQAALDAPPATDGFPVVLLRTDHVPPSNAAAPIVDNLPKALAEVAAGGKILVFPGTYLTQNVSINKPVTIEAEGSGTPVLDGGGASWILLIQDMAAGPVTLRGLRFVNAHDIEVHVGGTYDQVLVEDCDFAVPEHGTAFAYEAFASDATGHGITVTGSAFAGGATAIAGAGGDLTIIRNTFRGQSDLAVRWAFGTSGRVEGNAFSDCGLPFGCIGAFSTRSIDVTGNTIMADISRPLFSTIFINSDAATVEGNTITGTGGGGDRSDPHTYPIQNSAIQVASGSATISRNNVRNAFQGIIFTPFTGTAVDNVIDHTWAAFFGGGDPGTSFAHVNRNDVTDYVVPLVNAGVFGLGDFTCNWWGSPDGPHNPSPDFTPSMFTPWATQPIADKPAVSCP